MAGQLSTTPSAARALTNDQVLAAAILNDTQVEERFTCGDLRSRFKNRRHAAYRTKVAEKLKVEIVKLEMAGLLVRCDEAEPAQAGAPEAGRGGGCEA